MRTGVVHSSFLHSTMRMDGNFNLSDGLKVREDISESPYRILTIDDVTESIYCPGIFHRHYVNDGTPFLGGAEILTSNYDSGKYLKERTTPNHEILKIKKGWTLVTCGGTIGLAAFASSLLSKCWLSQHIMRLVPNNNIKEGVLYAYCASNHGYLLLTTNTYGTIIPTLNATGIGSLPIPDFPKAFQEDVHQLIVDAASLREEAASKVEEAKRCLLSFVHEQFTPTNGFRIKTTSVKEILSSLQLRLDPPAIINTSIDAFRIIRERCILLKDANIRVYRPGIFKRNYVQNGIPYIKGSEVFDINPFTRCEHLSRTRTPFVEQMALKKDQILITCAGSVGKIKLITKEYEDKQSIGSQDIIRLESYDPLYTSGFLFTYLQLPLVFDYIQSMKYGSVIERIEPFHIESIPVIKPTKEVSMTISRLIEEYSKMTYTAFCKEEKAISMVDAEIDSWKNN